MAVSKRSAKGKAPTQSSKAEVGPEPLPSWIRWARWIMPIFALLIVGGYAAFRFGVLPGLKATPRELINVALVNPPAPPAPDFTLTNQFGEPKSLSSFRGKPVALSFLYTNCIDVCPLIAWNMHLAYEELGNDAKNIGLVAVTVDPERDTPAQMLAFSATRQLTNQWDFFTGTRPVLQDVWRTYQIPAQGVDVSGSPILDVTTATPREIEHGAPTDLIDKQGRIRAMMPYNFEPETLTHNLRVLLAE
jgi:protein SCO1